MRYNISSLNKIIDQLSKFPHQYSTVLSPNMEYKITLKPLDKIDINLFYEYVTNTFFIEFEFKKEKQKISLKKLIENIDFKDKFITEISSKYYHDLGINNLLPLGRGYHCTLNFSKELLLILNNRTAIHSIDCSFLLKQFYHKYRWSDNEVYLEFVCDEENLFLSD